MVDVAQLVRVPDCDSGCCRFESGHPPAKKPRRNARFFVLTAKMVKNMTDLKAEHEEGHAEGKVKLEAMNPQMQK